MAGVLQKYVMFLGKYGSSKLSEYGEGFPPYDQHESGWFGFSTIFLKF